MLDLLAAAAHSIPDIFKSKKALLAENIALRQQLAVLHRQQQRPKIKTATGCFGLSSPGSGRIGARYW